MKSQLSIATLVLALALFSSSVSATTDTKVLEQKLASCEAVANKAPFLGSELVLCGAERAALVAVYEPAFLACNAAAMQPQFLGSELVLCGAERAALVRVKYQGYQGALPF